MSFLSRIGNIFNYCSPTSKLKLKHKKSYMLDAQQSIYLESPPLSTKPEPIISPRKALNQPTTIYFKPHRLGSKRFLYEVKGDGLCFWRSTLALYQNNKLYLTEASTREVKKAVIGLYFRDDVFKELLLSRFINGVEETGVIPNKATLQTIHDMFNKRIEKDLEYVWSVTSARGRLFPNNIDDSSIELCIDCFFNALADLLPAVERKIRVGNLHYEVEHHRSTSGVEF